VLGLDWAPGESCTGGAYRIHPTKDRAVRDYLVARELVSYAYFETRYPVTLVCEGSGRGEPREALCYVVDRSHPQYAGGMDPDDQAAIIAEAIGPSGSNAEYLENTLAHLDEMGIPDARLADIAARVRGRRVA